MIGTVSLQTLLCIINNNVVIRVKLLLQCRTHFTGQSDKRFEDFYIKMAMYRELSQLCSRCKGNCTINVPVTLMVAKNYPCNLLRYLGRLLGPLTSTSELRCNTTEIYVSAVAAFTHLYMCDLDL